MVPAQIAFGEKKKVDRQLRIFEVDDGTHDSRRHASHVHRSATVQFFGFIRSRGVLTLSLTANHRRDVHSQRIRDRLQSSGGKCEQRKKSTFEGMDLERTSSTFS